MKKKTIGILIGIIGSIAIIVVGYTFIQKGENNKLEYQTAKIKRGDLKQVVMATGSLSPITQVEVGSQVSGRIAKLYADFNSRVKKGQVVAEIEQSLFITRVKQAEANYKMAEAALHKAKVNLMTMKRKYKRAVELFKKGMLSEEERDAAEDAYLSAQADLRSAEARLAETKAALDSAKVDLEHTVITSPVDGIVIARNVDVGQTVAASFQAPVLFLIANDLTKMQVDCNVDEADIGKVKEGQRATFVVDAYPEELFSGRVVQVRFNPVEVQNVVTYDTIIEVENPDLKLRPGMTATVSIITAERKDVLLVPNKALEFKPPNLSPEKLREELAKRFRRERGENINSPRSQQANLKGRRAGGRRRFKVIWLLKEGKLVPTPVVIGISNDNYTEIVRGRVEEGDVVVVGVRGSYSSNRSSSARFRFGPFGPPRRRR